MLPFVSRIQFFVLLLSTRSVIVEMRESEARERGNARPKRAGARGTLQQVPTVCTGGTVP